MNSYLILSTPLSLNSSSFPYEAPEDERGAVDFSKSHSSTGALTPEPCLGLTLPQGCCHPFPTATETMAATVFQTGEGTPGQETLFSVSTAIHGITGHGWQAVGKG